MESFTVKNVSRCFTEAKTPSLNSQVSTVAGKLPLGQDQAGRRNHPLESWLSKGGGEEGERTERIRAREENMQTCMQMFSFIN